MTISVKVSDGLGNQMFQYAFASFLEQKIGEKVFLDISHYKNNLYRNFELDLFNTHFTILPLDDIPLPLSCYTTCKDKILQYLGKINSFSYDLLHNLLEYHLDSLLYKLFVPGYVEQNSILSDIYSPLIDAKYYKGYRQSEKYFPGMRERLIKEFTPKHKLNTKNKLILDMIKASNSVSLHIRRGDYAKKSITDHPFLFPCNLQYYKNSIDFIIARQSNPSFFIFSDDIVWARSNLPSVLSDNPIYYIDCNSGEDSYKDMILMSHCKHNIIANSSFSRWGAWLNENKDKIVISPKERYSGEKFNKQKKSINFPPCECPESRFRI